MEKTSDLQKVNEKEESANAGDDEKESKNDETNDSKSESK